MMNTDRTPVTRSAGDLSGQRLTHSERLRLAGIEHRRLRAAGYDVTLEDVIEAWNAGVDASDWHSPRVTS